MVLSHQVYSVSKVRTWAMQKIMCMYVAYPANICHQPCNCITGDKNVGRILLTISNWSQARLSTSHKKAPTIKNGF